MDDGFFYVQLRMLTGWKSKVKTSCYEDAKHYLDSLVKRDKRNPDSRVLVKVHDEVDTDK